MLYQLRDYDQNLPSSDNYIYIYIYIYIKNFETFWLMCMCIVKTEILKAHF